MGYYNKMTLEWTWDPVSIAGTPAVSDSTFGNCIVSDYTGQRIIAGFKLFDNNEYPGVFRSEDGGSTWTSSPIIDTNVLDSTVIGLATSSTMNVVYAIISGSTTVYRSTDYGATWSEFDLGGNGLPQPPTSIAVSDIGSIVFGYDGGVITYTDGDGLLTSSMASGSNVQSVATNSAGTVIIAVLIGSVAGNGIFKGTKPSNGGTSGTATFSRITTSPVNPNDILWTSVACTLGRSEFVACYSGDENNAGVGGVVYSSNNGDNWTALTTAQEGYKYVAISPFGDGIAAVAGAFGLYYGLTTNGSAPTTLAKDSVIETTLSGVEINAVLIKTNATNIGPTGAGLNRPFVVGSNDGVNLYQATFTYNENQQPEADPTGPITPLSWTWAPASFPGITGKFVSSIISNTTGQNIFAGYALNNGTGIYPAVVRSINGGTGWTGPGVSGSILGSGNYYVGDTITNIGLAMSTDMTKMYAVVSGSSDVYFSTNQGLGWTGFAYLNQGTYQTPPNAPQAIACNIDGSEIVIIASTVPGSVENDAVYYKRRGSGTWQGDTGAGVGGTGYFDPPPFFSSIAIGATGGRVVATMTPVSGSTGGVYNADITDAEPSLTFIDDPSFNDHLLAWTSVSSAFGNTGGGFVVCNVGLASAGGTGTVFYSENGQIDWTRVYVGYTGAAPAGLFTYATISPDLTGIAVVDAYHSLVYYGKTGEAGMVPSFLTCDQTTPALTTQVLLKNGTVETVNVDLPYLAGRGYLVEQQSGVTGPLYVSSYESPPPPPPAICFKSGSLILCSIDGKDTYLPVESIVPGTLVKTYKHGDKKVVYIGSSKVYNNPSNGKKSLANLAKCTPEKYPELTSDLVLTGAHAILVGDLSEKEREQTLEIMGKIYITDDKYRLVVCLDDRADTYEEEGVFTIWHFALENEHYTRNYGVYANGLLVETASLRTMKEFSGMNLL